MSNKLTLNKIKSIKELEKEIVSLSYKTKDGEDVEINFNTNLSFSEECVFIDFIMDLIFTYDDEYHPEYREVATFMAMIKYMCNIPMPMKKVDGDSQYDILTCAEWMNKLNIFNECSKNVKLSNFLTKINKIISDKIEFKKQDILCTQKYQLQEAEFKLERLIEVFSNLGEQFEQVDLKELAKNTDNIANKDEKKLAEAVVDIRTAMNKDNK